MPSRTQCALCAAPVIRVPSSAPEIVCRSCRAKRRQRTCKKCEGTFTASPGATAAYCSIQCANKDKSTRPNARPGRTCEMCGRAYKATHKDQRTCGRPCGNILKAQQLCQDTCPLDLQVCACGGWFIKRPHRHSGRCLNCRTAPPTPHPVSHWVCARCGGVGRKRKKYCQPCDTAHKREKKRDESRARKKRLGTSENHRRRARRLGVVYQPVQPLVVYERDGWTCHICGDPIDRTVPTTSDWAASLDHVLPMACGGGHTYDNVRTSHRWCNSVKGTQSGFTLRV